MTDVMTAPRSSGSADLDQPDPTTLFGRYAALPTPIRWMTGAAMGILLLSVVQLVSGDGASALTAAGTSSAMLRFAVPILLAGLGGLFSERAGVVNIGLEGMMVLGTWFGAWGMVNFDSAWAGVLCAAIGGAIGGLLHAIATVSFGIDHIISGVAINILAPGLTRFLSDQVFSDWDGGSITQSPRATGLYKINVPYVSGAKLPDALPCPSFLPGSGDPTCSVLGGVTEKDWFFISDLADFAEGLLTQVSLFTVMAFVFVPLCAWSLWRTRLGLRIRISGERPEAGESLGVSIYYHKYVGVITSGVFAGLAGGFIALELAGGYREGQTLGRGFIGLAALIFGNWRPGGVMVGSLVFGYPFVLALRDGTGESTRALLLVIAILLTIVLVVSIRKQRRNDAIIAGVIASAMLLWWALSETAPNWLPNAMPYATVLLVLLFMSQRLRMPAADGQIYRKGG